MTHDRTPAVVTPAEPGELTLTQRIIRLRDLLPETKAFQGHGITPRLARDLLRDATPEDFEAVDAFVASLPADAARALPDKAWRPIQ